MKDYIPVILILIIVVAAGFGLYILARKLFPKKRAPEVKIDEEKIENKPEGKGGESDKNVLDDIASKHDIDSE